MHEYAMNKHFIELTLTINIIQYDLCFLIYAFTAIFLWAILYVCTSYLVIVPKYIFNVLG